jgi:hypothetical protein
LEKGWKGEKGEGHGDDWDDSWHFFLGGDGDMFGFEFDTHGNIIPCSCCQAFLFYRPCIKPQFFVPIFTVGLAFLYRFPSFDHSGSQAISHGLGSFALL